MTGIPARPCWPTIGPSMSAFGPKRTGLVIVADPFFTGHREQLGALTVRHAVPAISEHREFAAAGGLLSYGADSGESYRLTGIYTGRVLKGDKPSDLPVQQATKVELYLNQKTPNPPPTTVPPPPPSL